MKQIASPQCLMLDVGGITLNGEDRELLAHPATGGLILFSRNYEAPAQLRELVQAARRINPRMLIAVDQEGGRVQRFRDGFTRLPSMAALAREASRDAPEAERQARQLGRLMAEELLQYGLDISFAPVLDLDHGVSEVIGDRSFGATPEQVIRLAGAWIAGMKAAGMAATGKHFPGHGGVAADSHTELPVDRRSLEEIRAADLKPFQALIAQLSGIMPAHVVYEQVAPEAAGFSPFWLRQVLREELKFSGVIFSDDLAMAGAAAVGAYPQRAEAALEAGCDMALVCNDRAGAIAVLEHLERWSCGVERVPASTLCARTAEPMTASERRAAQQLAMELGAQHEVV